MEITLLIDGKEKTFRSKGISFKTMRKGSDILPKYREGEFLGNDYPVEELDEAVEIILHYFNNQFTEQEFHDGYIIEDALEFLSFFGDVLVNIQINNGKREKMEEAQKKAHKTQKK